MSGRHRSAVAAYVRAHDRIWDVDRMRGGDAPAASDAIEWHTPPATPSFGVGVALLLEFHCGPGNRRPVSGEPGTASHD
jgi:hypothetical protein